MRQGALQAATVLFVAVYLILSTTPALADIVLTFQNDDITLTWGVANPSITPRSFEGFIWDTTYFDTVLLDGPFTDYTADDLLTRPDNVFSDPVYDPNPVSKEMFTAFTLAEFDDTVPRTTQSMLMLYQIKGTLPYAEESERILEPLDFWNATVGIDDFYRATVSVNDETQFQGPITLTDVNIQAIPEPSLVIAWSLLTVVCIGTGYWRHRDKAVV